jgi:hypothetical protein
MAQPPSPLTLGQRWAKTVGPVTHLPDTDHPGRPGSITAAPAPAWQIRTRPKSCRPMAISTLRSEALQALVNEIFANRCISRQVQHELMQLLLSQTHLNSQDQAMANRLFEAIQQGRLRIVE